jgi:hypothetical protein
MQTIKDVQWEDYEIRYWNRNKFAYLGNGRVNVEVEGKRELLAPYIRNSDVPWLV